MSQPIMCSTCGITYHHEHPPTRCSSVWDRLCQLAIKRHRNVWRWCGSNPLTWPLHEMKIIAVYGLSTYDAAMRGLGETNG